MNRGIGSPSLNRRQFGATKSPPESPKPALPSRLRKPGSPQKLATNILASINGKSDALRAPSNQGLAPSLPLASSLPTSPTHYAVPFPLKGNTSPSKRRIPSSMDTSRLPRMAPGCKSNPVSPLSTSSPRLGARASSHSTWVMSFYLWKQIVLEIMVSFLLN